jgi:hypothetical protein
MRRRDAAAGLVALALAAGFGASTAVASSSDGHTRKGTIIGHVFPWNSTRIATVELFNRADRLVARRRVRESHPHFRFVVAPSRYKVELKAGGAVCGGDTTTFRVRANKTGHLNLSEACDNSY